MQELGRLIIESYFSILFLLTTQIITAVVSIKHRKKFGELEYFHFYPIASLLQTLASLGSIVFINNYTSKVQYPSVSLFVMIEFFIIYNFSFKIIGGNRERFVLKTLFTIYIIYIIIMWTFT